MSDSSITDNQSILALYGPRLPLATSPVVGADYGVPKDVYDLQGCAVVVDPYLWQQANDTVSITVNGAPDVDSRQTQGESDAVTLIIPPQELQTGRLNYLTYSVRRGSENLGTYDPPLRLLYNSIRPGDHDRTPGDNAHSELVLLLPDEINNGVGPGFSQATVCVEYPYCRAYDRIRLNCNGSDVYHVVTATQAPPPPSHGSATPTRVCFIVTSADLGPDSQHFQFSFTVNDQLNNAPDEDARWSAVQVVDVDQAGARLPVPIPREDTSDNSDDPSIIDRDKLAADGPLSLIILTSDPRFRTEDTIMATYTTKVAGQSDVVYNVSGIVEGEFGQNRPCVLQVPNAQVISGSTVHMAYQLLRGGVLQGTSRTAIAMVIGQGGPVPDEKPMITWAQGSSGTPISNGGTTTDTTVIFTGTALENGQVEIFRNGTPLAIVTASSTGSWTYTASGLPIGLLSFIAKAKYGGELTSDPWGFTVQSASVELRINRVEDGNGIDIQNGSTTSYSMPVLHGTASPLRTLDLYDGARAVGIARSDTTGAWQGVVTAPLSTGGLRSLTARYRDNGESSNVWLLTIAHVNTIANFDSNYDGWIKGPAAPHANDMTRYNSPTDGWVLANWTYTNNNTGVVLYKSFRLQKGQAYEFTVPALRLRVAEQAIPYLSLQTSLGQLTSQTQLGYDWAELTGKIDAVPDDTDVEFRVVSHTQSGSGNDYHIGRIRVRSLTRPTILTASDQDGNEVPKNGSTTGEYVFLSGFAMTGVPVRIFVNSEILDTVEANSNGEWTVRVPRNSGGYKECRASALYPIEDTDISSVGWGINFLPGSPLPE
jgi:hypothetical protein